MPPVPPKPPTADEALYVHYPHVKDALLKGDEAVTNETVLATLYLCDNDSVDNRLIKNITGVCGIRPPCQISSDFKVGPGFLPRTLEKGSHGFEMFLTFNLLAIAPSVRLEVHFFKLNEVFPYLQLALEFPFNDRGGKQLHDFEYVTDDTHDCATIRFSFTGATSEGFTLLPIVQHNFGDDEKEAVEILQSMATETTIESKHLAIFLQFQELPPADRVDFQKLIDRLPGGQGLLLPSINKAEWSNYPLHIPDEEYDTVCTPGELMSMDPPNLMVPLACPLTFGSIKHFQADHLNCAIMSHWETEKLLLLFAMGDHKVALYRLNEKPVIAMNFGPYPRNAIVDMKGFRIPNEFQMQITFSIPGVKETFYTAGRDPYLQGLPDHDAYFVINSHSLDYFKGQYSAPEDNPVYRSVQKLVPHPNTFFLTSVASAMISLEKPQNHKFHPIALGNSFDSLSPIDITSGSDISDATKDGAWKWLTTYHDWNEEQRKLIDQLKCAKGGIALATGTAGTGKTTVQMAMAVYFVKMGGRAACFAASNSNVVTQLDALRELTQATLGSKIRIIRIVSASRGIGFKHMTATQALAKRVGHKRGTVSTIRGLAFVLLDRRSGKEGPWAHTVEACMLEEAEKQELSHPFRYRDRSGRIVGSAFDAWKEFRRHLEASLTEQFWENEPMVKQYAESFEACKGHLISLADIVITTNSNAQCADLERYWACVTDIKRLGVFVDEVGKEQEITVWNAILSKGLPRAPDFCLLLGDPQQLSPFNTSITKGMQCNAFASRATTSMLTRLITLGFPHTHLDVQQRIHPTLWAFPSSEFYGDDQCNVSETKRTLENTEPGLKTVLNEILAKSISNGQYGEQKRADYVANATDEQTRLHYLDFGVKGETGRGFKEKSRAIVEHIQAVMTLILPALQQHFGKRMHREVMIVAAYSNAVNQYHKKVHALQEEQKLNDSHYPRITTIDSAQGQEAKLVISDNSMLYSNFKGFMHDRGRCNVAMTRAKEVFWIVGGPLTTSSGKAPTSPLSPFPKLKQLMESRGQVHKFSI